MVGSYVRKALSQVKESALHPCFHFFFYYAPFFHKSKKAGAESPKKSTTNLAVKYFFPSTFNFLKSNSNSSLNLYFYFGKIYHYLGTIDIP